MLGSASHNIISPCTVFFRIMSLNDSVTNNTCMFIYIHYTGCGTDYCTVVNDVANCPSMRSNKYWTVYNGRSIGSRKFVCRKPPTSAPVIMTSLEQKALCGEPFLDTNPLSQTSATNNAEQPTGKRWYVWLGNIHLTCRVGGGGFGLLFVLVGGDFSVSKFDGEFFCCL